MVDNYDKESPRWVEGVQRGDKGSFEKLFMAYFDPLAKFAYQYLKSSHVAQELTQDVFLKLWEHRSFLDPEKNIRSWLYRAVRNEALNHIRDEKTADEYNKQIDWMKPAPITQIHQFDEESEFLRQAKKAISELPERARLIYKLNRKDGLTYQEIAEVLEISHKTVESQMGRALKMLRQSLSRFLPAVAAFILSRVV